VGAGIQERIRTGEVSQRTDASRIAGWWPEAGLLAGFLALTAALADGVLLDLDVAVRNWCLDARWEPLYLLCRVLNQFGSANLLGAVALVIAVALGVRTRSARPVLPIVAAFALSYLLVGPVKLATDRAAPRDPAPDAVELFADPDGWSYPSGHVVNAFIWYQVLVLLADAWLRAYDRSGSARPTPRRDPGTVAGWPELPAAVRRTLRVAPPVVISFTVTYLAFHWLTDVLAAILLGLLLDRLLVRLLGRIRWRPPVGR
jgi:membrane-associated phospholipid phosphatase